MFNTEFYIIETMDTLENTIKAYQDSGIASIYGLANEENPLFVMFTQLNVMLHRLSDGAKIKNKVKLLSKLDKASRIAQNKLDLLDSEVNRKWSY